jgi:hypothetical protein
MKDMNGTMQHKAKFTKDTMQQTTRKNSHLGLIIVVGTLTVLMLILLTAVAILFFTNQFGATNSVRRSLLTGTGPLDMVDVDQVDPALALASLGGVPEVDVIDAAVDKARPETALSSILFKPGLTDKESAGSLLLLAAAYGADSALSGEAREKAISSYKMAGTIATLSPEIPDTVRADIFLQAGEGLAQFDESELAKFYFDQAFLVAARSPYLQAVRRRAIFERLQKNYIILGEREAARTSLNSSATPPDLAVSTLEEPILAQTEAVPLSALAQEAEANRWRRAQELAAILVDRGGKAPEATVAALREALIEEDRQKIPFYEGELATAARLSKKIDITQAQIEWLTTKYRVARRAYGISLVPEWEAQAEQIRADLTKTYERLFALYADLIVALPEVSQIDRATEERLRREILAGELGRYPNYPEEQRQKQLSDATNQLEATQPEIYLLIGVDTVADEEMYTMTARE